MRLWSTVREWIYDLLEIVALSLGMVSTSKLRGDKSIMNKKG